MMNESRLQELTARFPSLRIAVIGDFFLDKYLDVDPRIADTSVESGKTAHQVVRIRHSPGAAGTIVSNLSALGAGVLHAVGVVGDDGEAHDLVADLGRLRCSTNDLHRAADRMTPTYLKPRDLTDPSLKGEHERYDTKNRTPTPGRLVRLVVDSLDALLPDLDAVIVQDQVEAADCGVVTSEVRAALSDRAKRYPDCVFWVDSRVRIHEYRNLITKPNQFEAVGWESPIPGDEVEVEELREAVRRLRRTSGAPVCATMGEKGMMVSDPEVTAIPGVRLEGETDPTGAGDSVSAGAVLALAAGATLPEAALVANLVASITVQQLAVTGTARPEQLPERLALWHTQQEEKRR